MGREWTSWLLREPIGVVPEPEFDKCVLFLLKIFYLSLRLLLRIVVGKKKRNKLFTEHKLYFNDNLSPSLSLLTCLFKAIKFLQLDHRMLIKIKVPKYGYKVYCPASKEDVIMMTRHEDEIIERFTPKEGDVVVDIGAHIGRYTIISSKRVGQNGKVIAIEAHPGNFEMLNRNIKLNNLTNVIPLNYAAYSKQTKLDLYWYMENSTGHNSIMLNYKSTNYKGNFVQVNTNTLDDLLLQQQNGINEVNWIKIDVEGAELEVLKGAVNTLSKSKDISLLIEIHTLQDGTNSYNQIIQFLKVYNFKIEFEKPYEDEEKHIIVRKSAI
jgi:FkbM family methyltransferase